METIPACWKPIDTPRAANCKNCGRRIYARVGDTHNGYQVWRHVNRDSWASSWCYLDQSLMIYTMADPDLSTLEWVKALVAKTATIDGYRGSWTFEIPFYRGKHREGVRRA